LLVLPIHCDFSGRDGAFRAGLNFDEAKQGAVPRDQIDVGGDVARGPTTCRDGVTLALQVEEGGVFAFNSNFKMSGEVLGPTAKVS
jgi:hypothetical protein